MTLGAGAARAGAVPPPPQPPLDLRVAATTSDSISVEWRRPAHAVRFGLYRDGAHLATTSHTRWTVRGLRCGRRYELAVDSVGPQGARSQRRVVAAATAECADTEPPTRPAGLHVTDTSESSIEISWRPSEDDVGVVAYELTRDGAGAGSTTDTVHTFDGLACEETHTFGVRARDAAGNLSREASVTARTGLCPPLPPAELRLVASTVDSISVEWERPPNVVLFGLYRDGERTGHTPLTHASFGGLSCGTSYEIGVDSVSFWGARSERAVLRVATAECPDQQAPTAPTGLRVTTATESSVTIAWNASTDDTAVTGYELSLNGAAAGSTTATSHTFGNLGCAESHTFGVRARDAAGHLSAETTFSARTSACPADLYVAADGSDFRWAHLAATYDGAAIRLFVDGRQVATRQVGGAMPASAEPLRLGGNAVWGEWFRGRIDNLRIYARALTPDELGAAMNAAVTAGAPAPEADGLVAAYSFDAGSGSALDDVSDNGNDGIVLGATWTPNGRFGGALSFDGVDDWVTIADATSLDLAGAMTLEAWVRVDALGDAWRTVLVKEQAGHLVYALYANTETHAPSGHVFVGGSDTWARGSDPLAANTCGRGDPCAGFDRAYDVARAGDVVEVAAGEYPLQVIALDASRTGPESVVFRPAADADVHVAGFDVRARYVELRGFTAGSVTTFATAEDVVLRDLDVRGGLFIFSSQRVSMLGGSVGPGVDFHPMIAAEHGNATPPRDIVLDGVLFTDWTRSNAGVHTECLQIGAGDGVTIRNSRFRNCDVMAMHVTHFGLAPLTRNVTIENNFFSASGDGGFHTIQAYAFENLLIRNNSMEQEFVIFTDDPVRSPNVNVRVIGNIAPRLPWQCERDVVFRYNVFAGGTCGPTDLNAPLAFVDAAAGDFHLRAGAAAVDRGDPTSFPATDIDGDARPAGDAPDAGADEVPAGGG